MGNKTSLFFDNAPNELGEGLTRRNELEVTLNCWELGRQRPATVVIRLQRDNRSFLYRTNCEALGWAKSVDSPTLLGIDHTTPISKV